MPHPIHLQVLGKVSAKSAERVPFESLYGAVLEDAEGGGGVIYGHRLRSTHSHFLCGGKSLQEDFIHSRKVVPTEVQQGDVAPGQRTRQKVKVLELTVDLVQLALTRGVQERVLDGTEICRWVTG